jgi:hypothetical protein
VYKIYARIKAPVIAEMICLGFLLASCFIDVIKQNSHNDDQDEKKN